MKGFTLIETIIILALFSVLVGLGLLMSMETLKGTTRRSERDVVVSVLERARSRAMANIDETSWSVCYDAGNYIISKDAVACDDTSAYDRIEANEYVADSSDFSAFPITFTQLSGTVATAAAGEQELIVVQDGREEKIQINYEGRINW